MKPYGREKKIKNGWGYKVDCHPKKLGKEWVNWWEDMCTIITRSTMKQNLKKEIDKELE